ncbi:hypothetical protein [Streptomyces sp. NPDC001833]|uniref:hypothetical protein n=1 Tax=Streptomyces sp. NPDC001833 TaxID=3154658 RepID=UPI00331DBB5E
MRNRDRTGIQEVEHLDQARLACPDIARACDLARAFTDLVNGVKTIKRAMYGRASFRLLRIRTLTRLRAGLPFVQPSKVTADLL